MSTAPSKRTPLFESHVALGARIVPFSGWDMPVQYSSIRDEHRAVRTAAGLFDVSHMGEFSFRGDEARSLLQFLTTNDIDRLEPGACHYTFFLNAAGGTVDDAVVYRRSEDEFLVVVNAGNIAKDWAHVKGVAEDRFPGADIQDVSDEWALMALQGPGAFDIAQPLVRTRLDALPFHAIAEDRIEGADVLIATSGYTGENGLEIFSAATDAERLWAAFTADPAVIPCGLGARDTLRLEASLALYGHELDEETSPIEARLGFAVSESGDYVGADVVARQRAEGTDRSLVMIEMVDRAIPRQGYRIVSSDGKPVGTVTSGSLAPWLEKNIGMGYVTPAQRKVGTEIGIEVRDRVAAARVVKRPFYSRPKR